MIHRNCDHRGNVRKVRVMKDGTRDCARPGDAMTGLLTGGCKEVFGRF